MCVHLATGVGQKLTLAALGIKGRFVASEFWKNSLLAMELLCSSTCWLYLLRAKGKEVMPSPSTGHDGPWAMFEVTLAVTFRDCEAQERAWWR